MLDHITPVLLTFNEEPNIARTLAHLAWAKDIVVVDSGSTDGTLLLWRTFQTCVSSIAASTAMRSMAFCNRRDANRYQLDLTA
jgi:hypothetical protein